MEDHDGAECLDVFGRHPVLEEMRKHADRKRHEHVGEEFDSPNMCRHAGDGPANEQVGAMFGHEL